jgi:drug/metabolite transporter (DMT)-like permease
MNDQREPLLNTRAGAAAAAIFANFLWGSASPCIKLGYRLFQISADDVMSQILFAGVRFTLAGVMTILFASLMQKHILLPEKGSGKMILTLACTQTIIQYTFFYLGLSKAPGFKGSVISPSSAFFAVLLSTLILRQEKLTFRKCLGCAVGFAGVIVINLNKQGGGGNFRWDGEGFLLLSALSSSVSTVLLKQYAKREDPVTLSGYQFIVGGCVMAFAGFLCGGRLAPVSAFAWLLLGYLVFLSATAYTLWSLLLQRYPVSSITVFSFANPVFGVLLSALILGEGKLLNWFHCITALVLVSAGIWIVNAGSPERQKN